MSQKQAQNMPRLWDEKGFLPFRLEVLSPVFIGSGENFSPLEYVIRKESDAWFLYLIDTAEWLASEYNSSAVQTALEKGDALVLRRLAQERVDISLYALSRVPITLKSLGQAIEQNIINPGSNSKAEIQTFVRNPVTNTPFIPGSSLKGSISTPIIDCFDKDGGLKVANARGRQGYAMALETIFGKIDAHAMQALKVSDVPVPPEGSCLVQPEPKRLNPKTGVKNNPGASAHITPPCEAIPQSRETSLSLYGSLHIDSRCGEPAITVKGTPYPWDTIQGWCNAFYKDRFMDEWEKFYTKPHFSEVKENLRTIKEKIENLPENTLLLRVGHYSHVESVTVTHNAPGGIKGVHGTTRTLADSRLPFGWVLLHFCGQEEYENGLHAVEEDIALSVENYAHARLLETEKREKQAREQRLRKEKEEKEAKQKAKEEAEHAERWASLSPEERLIDSVKTPGASEEDSTALFLKLDSLEADSRQKAAMALRDYWICIDNKWKGKLSKKQAEKVKKVRGILGE